MQRKKQNNKNVPNKGLQPSLRFKEFMGQWNRRRLEEVAEVSSGGTPSRNKDSYWNGDIPWVSTTLIDFNLITDTEEKITEEGLRNSSAKLFPKDSLLMAMYGQGKTRGKVAMLGIDSTTNQACASIMTNREVLDSSFLFQNLSKRYHEIRDLSNRGGQENLSGTIIKSIEISFPSLTEQKRIADFFSLINERILAQSKIIAQLQTLMTGLREQLFKQKIRFKDNNGNDYPDWEEKKLGEVCEIIMGQSPNSSFYNSEKIGLPLIQGNADIENRKTNPRNYTSEITKECKRGDLILTVRAPVGTIAKSVHNACIGRGVCAIRKTKEINIEFIYQFLLDFEPNWIVLEQGSTFTAVSGNEIKNITFFVPHLAEQALIANFLSSIDGKMETEKGILQQYENQKKYLLQNMFI